MIGCIVETRAGRIVGRVRTVWETGGSAVLVLSREGGGEDVLIPFSRTICPEIDVRAKRIAIDPPDGLLELNEI